MYKCGKCVSMLSVKCQFFDKKCVNWSKLSLVEKQIGNEKDKTKWKLRTDIKLVNTYGTKRWKT